MMVTIDGPAGSGKSTVARAVAQRLGWTFIDTGAMYRAAAWQADRLGIERSEAERLVELSRDLDLSFAWSNDELRVIVEGQDVTDELREERLSALASAIATIGEVRSAMVDRQRELASRFENVITEGRDQGSVAFPDADLKIFLDASVEERAKRRCRQLAGSGQPADYDQILDSIQRRDMQDRSRAAAPLVIPHGAVRLDTTDLTLDQVISRVLDLIEATRGR